MSRFALALALLATLGGAALRPTPAQAQNARSWVSSTGSGSTCSRSLPCGSFGTALGQTNAGGEVNCVDQGDFAIGGLAILHSVTIDCEGVQARITGPSGASAVAIDGASTDVVVLRGLDISGDGVSTAGINFLSGAALHVEKCVVHDVGNSSQGFGILLGATVASATVELYVSDTVVINNNGGANAAGILVRPAQSNVINKVILNHVEARNNTFGIKADGTLTTGGVINMTVRDSVASGNSINGIVGTGVAGGPAVVMMIDNSTASHNAAGYGVIADGPKTFMQMSRSTASGNNFGIGATGGGQLLSYGNNQVALNSTDGAATGAASFK